MPSHQSRVHPRRVWRWLCRLPLCKYLNVCLWRRIMSADTQALSTNRFAIGFFIFGFTSYPYLPWIAPAIGGVVIGFSGEFSVSRAIRDVLISQLCLMQFLRFSSRSSTTSSIPTSGPLLRRWLRIVRGPSFCVFSGQLTEASFFLPFMYILGIPRTNFMLQSRRP